jgi:trigger factor
MQTTTEHLKPTLAKLTIIAEPAELDVIKQRVLLTLGRRIRVPGFRAGKAPLAMIEKQVDSSQLHSEFLEQAINDLYAKSLVEARLRPVDQPKVTITKFVPFETLEISAEVVVVGQVKVGDYKKIKLALPKVSVTAKDVDEVIDGLRARVAEKKEVTRAAKDGDEVVIDFAGTDTKTKEPINGADGKSYPLVLGSNSFIPGFEPNLIGLKAGESKTFQVTFPKDYSVAALQNRKVSFDTTIHTVKSVKLPKVDDAFAAQAGPFKTLADLKADIKRQVETEREQQITSQYQNELIEKIASQATVDIPDSLIDEEVERSEARERQNLTYRGQTWQEHLTEEGVDEAGHRAKQRAPALARVKAGLVLAEIAEQEGLDVTPDELNMQITLLKGQYTDKQMQAELDKPDNRRDIASRILTDKTLSLLTQYATAT